MEVLHSVQYTRQGIRRQNQETGLDFGRDFLSALGLATEGQIYTVSRDLVTQQLALQAAFANPLKELVKQFACGAFLVIYKFSVAEEAL